MAFIKMVLHILSVENENEHAYGHVIAGSRGLTGVPTYNELRKDFSQVRRQRDRHPLM